METHLNQQTAVGLNECANDQIPDEAFDLELLAAFITESEEQLEAAQEHLLVLESEPQNADALNALFRACHTIKGNAGFMKIDPTLKHLAHDAETVLSLCRAGDLCLSGQAFELVLESVSMLGVLLRAISESAGGTPSEDVASCCKDIRDGLLLVAHGGNHNTAQADEEQDSAQGEITENSTDPDFFGDQNAIDDMAFATVTATEAKLPKSSPITDSDASRSKNPVANETLRVDRNRLDQLVELIGELVIAESMTQQDAQSSKTDLTAEPRKLRNLAQLNRITRTLQELSLSLRMVPLKSTFQKMNRVARDLMRKVSKKVDFIIEGENTELDKTFVDEIGDPLMHMVRNAIDHGIEASPEIRVAAGKPAVGKVVLRAFHQSGNIHIEIQDDGRGLNVDRILAKAKQQKLIAEDANLSEQEILNLIFEPGFSTAEKVTDVSGRGVGMDVVRRNIQALRGSIDIKTKEGEGSCFTIRMPLTLAIINGLIVRVGDVRFVIPTLSVTELMRLEGSKISTIVERYSILTVRDQNVPLVRLDRILGLHESKEQSPKAIIVVVQEGPHSAAISVDEVLGQQQVVIKQLGHYLQGCRGVAGGAIMPDGQVGIILDIHGIISQARGN